MSPVTLRRNNPTAFTAVVSVAILLTAVAAYPQTVTDKPSSSAQSSQATSTSKSAPMGSAADASGNAGSAKAGAKASGDAAGKMAKGDVKFMQDIATANIAEVATGKLALSKSQNEQVKTFAQKMVDDHTKAQQELEQIAQKKGVELPKEPDSKHKAAAAALDKLNGDKFDAMYMKQAGENDHENTHKLLQKVSKSAKDPDLKAYADKTISAVDQHLKMANDAKSGKKADKSVGSSGSGSTGSGSK